MTAEIIIMNKEAIALAADSAATLSGGAQDKIFSSANKLFALSHNHPVGIMVFGNASFMDIPWEVIIKIYRNKLGNNGFDKLTHYTDDFIAFLDKNNVIFTSEIQDRFFQAHVFSFYNYLKQNINKEVDSFIKNNGKIFKKQIRKIVHDTISNHYQILKRTENIPSLPKT